ncbi:beta-ketoacyl-[acyl-carrier-protein] synthase family protein [Kineosporia succinea]|uniref:3-oxoacyl-[acyl-carrier-protein] synthase 1 n=1 Tax=Kineosporia succinea TaxID=84632 RepID=A0ABT9P8D5_9ACTN|nr:beta-ketoacyl-[acyl-carrier-protein] synthase family protein [Kineosporia succinea]MDP9828420.1 3-oxoacyl-[acyl-carrier-protein] synthase II [Kineosporia succinea]
MPEPLRRVAVTGLGVVSSLGIGVRDFTASVRAGRSGVSPISSFDASRYEARNAGEVRDFEPGRILRTLRPHEWGRSAQFAAAAARLAVGDSGIDPERLSAGTTGSGVGTASGEPSLQYEMAQRWSLSGGPGMSGRQVRAAGAGQLAAAVSTELGLHGEALTFGTACSASNYALGYGFDLIRTGQADFFLAGGADSVSRTTHHGFSMMGIVSEVERPFDLDRSGIVPAEGGVSLLLEPLDHAVARGARIYAEVLGYGLSCDAAHMVHPDVSSIARCYRNAHASAGVRPEQVDYVCAHGTGTIASDEAEILALREVFGDAPPPVSSIKSMLGHTMGASSGLGSVICCMAIHQGFVPPTATLEKVDPALGEGLDLPTGTARPARVDIAQNHGLAFGGNNAVVVLGRVR